MLIQIIGGTYGYRVGRSIIPKTPKDEPFEVADEQAERLIRLKVARPVSDSEELPAEEDACPDDIENMKREELLELAADLEIAIPEKAKKKEIILLIRRKQQGDADCDDGADDGSDDIEAGDGEQPPTFDAAPPVQ